MTIIINIWYTYLLGEFEEHTLDLNYPPPNGGKIRHDTENYLPLASWGDRSQIIDIATLPETQLAPANWAGRGMSFRFCWGKGDLRGVGFREGRCCDLSPQNYFRWDLGHARWAANNFTLIGAGNQRSESDVGFIKKGKLHLVSWKVYGICLLQTDLVFSFGGEGFCINA